MMLTASVVTLAAVALAYQYTLPQIWSEFQFVGDGTGKYDYAVNAVILGSVLILFTTVINALGVKLMARINSAGVFIELIAAVLLIVLLAVNVTRGPDVLFETQGTGEGHDWGYLGAFLTAALASAYVMYGFDTASSLGEETIDPRRTAPKAIMRAVVASFLLGGMILLFAILAVSDINSPEIAAGGLQFVVLDVFGSTVGKIFLISVAIAITVCCLAVHTATIRMMFAMARDNNLPAGERLAKVHPKTKTPIVPAVLIGVLALLILVVNIRQPQIFTVITSIGIIMIYIAYLLVTVPMLVSRLRGEWPPKGAKESGYFSLGKLGLPINIARRRLGRGHGDQPRLAAQGRLQRDRALPLVPPVRRDPVHRRRLLRRARLLLVRAAPQDRRARVARGRVAPRPRCRRPRRRPPRRLRSSRGMATRMFIDGEWCDAASGATVEATSPATGESLGPVAEGDREDARRAIAAANAAFPAWAARTGFERAALLHRVADVCERRRDELARVLTLDQGKPLKAEAEGEVGELIEFFRMAAEDGKRIEGRIPESAAPGRRVLLLRRPLGVLGLITPWNWPYTMPAEVLAPALACGNCVVWTPAPSTAVCSGLLAECVAEADLPPGVFNMVLGPGPEVGDELAVNPGTRAVAFTGSTATGLTVSRRAAGKAQLLEMGGNGPFVVMDDADLEAAAEAARVGCFLGAGQSCSAAERLLVHEAVREEFVALLAGEVEREVRLGDPLDDGHHDGSREQRAGRGEDGRARGRRRGARRDGGGGREPRERLPDRPLLGADGAGRRAAGLDRGHPGDLRADRADHRRSARWRRRSSRRTPSRSG